ncbi:MAG TPA: hypothetical protein VI854_08120 [Acidimicrobiia bacterium]|nr:hypothetical protein [Acidimicrobiia bacterium]
MGAGGRPVARADDLHAVLDGGDGPLTLSIVRGVEEIEVAVTFDGGAG